MNVFCLSKIRLYSVSSMQNWDNKNKTFISHSWTHRRIRYTLRFGCSSMQSFSPEMCDRERQTVRQRQTDSDTNRETDTDEQKVADTKKSERWTQKQIICCCF